jgi:hypothetical protein
MTLAAATAVALIQNKIVFRYRYPEVGIRKTIFLMDDIWCLARMTRAEV